MSMAFRFPEGMTLPPLLAELQQEVPALFGSEDAVSEGFAFYAQPPVDTAHWFASKAASSALAAANQLGVFGCAPDGSLFALWRAPGGGLPVVYLGSEGATQVLSADFAHFLRLLVIGYEALEVGVYDTPPESAVEVTSLLRDWLDSRGLNVPPTGEYIVSEAEQAYPDFHGWCEDASMGVLQNPASPPSTCAAPMPVVATHESLWDHLVSVIGKPVNAAEVVSLLQRLGARPLAFTQPRSPDTYVSVPGKGIEIRASCTIRHRGFWPPHREGRAYATYVHRVRLDGQTYGGPLPHGISWDLTPEQSMDMAPPSTNLVIRPVFDEGRLEFIDLVLPEERAYITVSPDYEAEKPLVYVEDAFFATWCALNGLLAPMKFTESILEPWRLRQRTPLAFLHGPCGGLLWSGDVQETFFTFLRAYYLGFCGTDQQTWRSDIKRSFGSANHFRDLAVAMTPDSWDAYDRVAKRIELRFREWKAEKLKVAEWL